MKKWKKPKIKHLKFTKYCWLVSYPKNLKLGKNTDIGALTYINARYGVTIEDDVKIGAHCSIYSDDTERNIHGEIIIKKGVKIGAHTIILPKRFIPHYISKNIKAGSILY